MKNCICVPACRGVSGSGCAQSMRCSISPLSLSLCLYPSLRQQLRSEKRICSSNKLQSKYCWQCQVFDVDEKYLQAYYFIWRRQWVVNNYYWLMLLLCVVKIRKSGCNCGCKRDEQWATGDDYFNVSAIGKLIYLLRCVSKESKQCHLFQLSDTNVCIYNLFSQRAKARAEVISVQKRD